MPFPSTLGKWTDIRVSYTYGGTENSGEAACYIDGNYIETLTGQDFSITPRRGGVQGTSNFLNMIWSVMRVTGTPLTSENEVEYLNYGFSEGTGNPDGDLTIYNRAPAWGGLRNHATMYGGASRTVTDGAYSINHYCGFSLYEEFDLKWDTVMDEQIWEMIPQQDDILD